MTKEKLLALYRKLQKGEITAEKIVELKDLSDEEIDIILNCNNPINIKKLLTNGNFKKLSKEIKKELIAIIDAPYRDTIIATINYYATQVATDQNAIASGLVVELTRIVRKSTDTIQAEVAAQLACHPQIISTGKVIELTTIVSQCRKKLEREHIHIVGYTALDSNLAKSGRLVEVVQSVASASDKKEALRIYDQESVAAKNIRLIDALIKGNIGEIDFWQLFVEDSNLAMAILNETALINSQVSPYEAEVLEMETIYPIEKTDNILKNNKNIEYYPIHEENSGIVRDNPEILPHARIRIKKQEVTK